MTIAGHDEAIVMVEAECSELDEETMIEALALAKDVCADVAALVTAFADEAGKTKMEWIPPSRDEELDAAIEKKFGKKLKATSVTGGDKHERGAARADLIAEVHEAFPCHEDDDPRAVPELRRESSLLPDFL